MTRPAEQTPSKARRSLQIGALIESEDVDRMALARQIIDLGRPSAWVELGHVVGLPGIPGTVADLRTKLLAEGFTVDEGRYSPDYQLSYECLLTALPTVTLRAYLAKLQHERAERKSAADALAQFKRQNVGVSIFVRAVDLVGLPGLPGDVPGAREWAKQKGYIAGLGVEADFLPPAGLQEWIRRTEAAASAKALEQAAVARQLAEFETFLDAEAARAAEPARPEAPEPWALMAVLSKVALARIAGKGLRLTAEQTAILFVHLEERSAA